MRHPKLMACQSLQMRNPRRRQGGDAMMGDEESVAGRIRRIRGAMRWRPRSWSDVTSR